MYCYCITVLYSCTLVWPRDIFLAWIKYQRNIGLNTTNIMTLTFHSFDFVVSYVSNFHFNGEKMLYSDPFRSDFTLEQITSQLANIFWNPCLLHKHSAYVCWAKYIQMIYTTKLRPKFFFFLHSKPVNFRVKFNQFLNGLPLSFCHLCCILCAGFLKYS